MPTFLIKYQLFEGVHEHTAYGLVEAKSHESATNKAKRALKDFGDYGGDEVPCELHSVTQIYANQRTALIDLGICGWIDGGPKEI